MFSAFCARCFGLGLTVSDEELEEINQRRNSERFSHYISRDAAMEIYGSTKKKLLTDEDKLTLVQSMMVGINADGYWNSNYMSLQIEDAVDVLSIVYPQCDIVFLMDQSSGHGKAAKDAIVVRELNKTWGGVSDAVEKMRDSIVREVGEYRYNDVDNPQLQVNSSQKLMFLPSDKGPFYVKEPKRSNTKTPQPKGTKRKYKYKNVELLNILQEKHNFVIRRRYNTEQIQNFAKERNVPLEIELDDIEPGWENSPKGLLQLLYERQMIDKSNLTKYSMSGLKKHKDTDGKVLPQYKKYVLVDLMKNCTDIKEQRSSMEELLDELSTLQDQKVVLLTSPKYHCEIAGEGIELCWGLMKKIYRSIPLEDKRKKVKFLTAVHKCLNDVTVEHVGKFAAKTRRYMVAYQNIDVDKLSYEIIEKFVKKIRTHRSMADIDIAFIEKVWRETYTQVITGVLERL